MGLFGPPKYFRERTFTMPCSRVEALQVIAASLDTDGNLPFGALASGPLDQPPLVEGIYLETLSEDGFTLAAGNRVQNYWRRGMSLRSDHPTHGVFGAIDVHSDKWFLNVMGAVFALERAVRSVGGKTEKWPTM